MKNSPKKVTKEVLPRMVNDCFSVHNLCNDGKYLFAVQHLFTKHGQYPSQYKNDVIMDFHFHKGYELEIIISGEIKNIYDNKTNVLKQNTFYIMSPDDVHAVSFTDETDTAVLLNVAFDEFILSDPIKKFLKCREFPVFGNVSDEFIEYLGITIEKLTKIKQVMPNEESYNEMLYKMFEALIVYLVNISSNEKNKKITVTDMGKLDMYEVIKYVREHYKEKLTISELAKKCGYSANYFSSKFKEVTNKTLIEYVNDMRMVEAYKRMISSDEPIYSISSDMGYSNLTYFYKKFKEKFGCLPEEARKRSIHNSKR